MMVASCNASTAAHARHASATKPSRCAGSAGHMATATGAGSLPPAAAAKFTPSPLLRAGIAACGGHSVGVQIVSDTC